MKHKLLVALIAVLSAATAPSLTAETFSIGDNDFLLDGKPFQIHCGEMHFSRIPREYWANRLRSAHAMGLNTICAYLFWNIHEPVKGKFDFSGDADAAEFCRMAQAEGLRVVLRPGPYSCAEWDFGGLPWWLLKTPDIKVRTRDPRYLAGCKEYLLEVGKQLAPLQVTRGGPILMVQVENEYGSFGSDKDYIGILRDDLKEAGFDVPLFTCDGISELKNDTRNDIFCVVNMSGGLAKALESLRKVRPTGPLMIGEYYPGWFDSWGEPHHTGDTQKIVNEIGSMLEHDVSFSIYMVHGGTTFGFNAGANNYPPLFTPEITSYDYDAPISEAGWATPKFYALRELLSRHLNPGDTLPDVPPKNPVIEIPPIHLDECAPLFSNLPPAQHVMQPQQMELFDQAHGAILYRRELPSGRSGTLRFKDLNDYAMIFLDGQKIATVDRCRVQNSAVLPERAHKMTLDVLVDSFGHVTYGHGMGDRKGMRRAELETAGHTNALSRWEVFNLPFDAKELSQLNFTKGAPGLPAFYRGEFSLAKTGDTFLDMTDWTKGMVWINGHNLGRYWTIGPQQTLYCPAPWLKEGQNEIVVLEFNGARHNTVPGRTEPILDKASE